MRYAWLSLLLILCACSIKYGDTELSFMQMQQREGSASIYSTKLYGTDIEVPIPLTSGGASAFKFRLGYVGETKGIIPTKADGDLPDVCIDITQETDNAVFSDTYSTGKSSQLYQTEDK